MQIKKIIYTVTLLLVITLITTIIMIFPGRHIHRILVIQSYSKSMPTYSERDEKTKSQFQKNDINADIRVVYLDCERYNKKPEIIRINKLVKGATSDGWTPDIIITYNDHIELQKGRSVVGKGMLCNMYPCFLRNLPSFII